MTPASDRRKDDVLNLITKWVVVTCLPAILLFGWRLLVSINNFEKHLAKLEQRLDDRDKTDCEKFEKLQNQVSGLDGDFRGHLVDHSRRQIK